MPEQLIDRAIADVADRAPVDWDALEKEAGSQEDREWLDCLRILGGVANLHHEDEPDEDWSRHETKAAARPDDPVSDGDAKYWGRYRLVQKVGEGGFGSVYRAWDPELEREVAIKILHKRVADARLREGLLREGRALARIRHPHVVSVLGVETHEDQIALCMEFVHGETLEDALQGHGTLNAREAALVGEDVCRALAAVHLAGFVHRDVKARNVMREKAGRIVLMDFGAGQQAEDLKVPGRISTVGTPLYMAPEVLAGQPASACSDVYSVGVLLYRLVTGEYPVEGNTLDDIRAAHMQGRRRPLSERRPDDPRSFIDLVDRALAADPSKRYPTAAECLEALVGVVKDAQPKPRLTPTAVVLRVALVAMAGAAAVLSLGVLTSVDFNVVLGRTGFVQETAWNWFVWGLRSIVAPSVLFLQTVAAVALIHVVRRIAIAGLPPLARVEGAARTLGTRALRRMHLEDPSLQASLVLAVSATVLVFAWWWFYSLLSMFLPDGGALSRSSAESLSLLSPRMEAYHYLYRQVFFGVTTFAGFSWFVITKLQSGQREASHRLVGAGAASVLILSLASLDLPYRLLFNNTFEVASWEDSECYKLGERADDLLLFCPDLSPRNRVVKKGSDGLKFSGSSENVFTRFGPPANVNSPAER